MTDIKPMLLSEITGHRSLIESQDYVFVQPKLDGWRCMANTLTGKLYTRSGREITTLPHINASLPTSGPEWLDGELYRHGYSVDQIQSMIKRGDSRIEFHVFDCVSAENFSVRDWKVLQTEKNDNIKDVFAMLIDVSQINEFYKTFLENSYEGLVIRLNGYGYEHGRSNKIFKMKPGIEVL